MYVIMSFIDRWSRFLTIYGLSFTDRWTDWYGPEDLLAVHDFMSYVERAVFSGKEVERQFHTDVDFWYVSCIPWASKTWKDQQEIEAMPREELGMLE